MYIVSVGKLTFMMVLNRMMHILWQTAEAVANGTTTSAYSFKLKFFEIKSTTCNGWKCCLQKINYMKMKINYMKMKINYMKMKIRGFSVDKTSIKLCVQYIISAQCIVTKNT